MVDLLAEGRAIVIIHAIKMMFDTLFFVKALKVSAVIRLEELDKILGVIQIKNPRFCASSAKKTAVNQNCCSHNLSNQEKSSRVGTSLILGDLLLEQDKVIIAKKMKEFGRFFDSLLASE